MNVHRSWCYHTDFRGGGSATLGSPTEAEIVRADTFHRDNKALLREVEGL